MTDSPYYEPAEGSEKSDRRLWEVRYSEPGRHGYKVNKQVYVLAPNLPEAVEKFIAKHPGTDLWVVQCRTTEGVIE